MASGYGDVVTDETWLGKRLKSLQAQINDLRKGSGKEDRSHVLLESLGFGTGLSNGGTLEKPSCGRVGRVVEIRGFFARDAGDRTGRIALLPDYCWPSDTVWGMATASGSSVGEVKVFGDGSFEFQNPTSTALLFVVTMTFFAAPGI